MGQKGQQFERLVCKKLSLWWTSGKRDDIYWRTSGSGARAAFRGRTGRGTAGHCGDIACADEVGLPLLDLLTLELKKGYGKVTCVDLIDRPRNETKCQQKFEAWIQQAHEAHCRSGSFSWGLITNRHCRQPMIYMPDRVWGYMEDCNPNPTPPNVCLGACVRLLTRGGMSEVWFDIVGTPFDAWLKWVNPSLIKTLSREL